MRWLHFPTCWILPNSKGNMQLLQFTATQRHFVGRCSHTTLSGNWERGTKKTVGVWIMSKKIKTSIFSWALSAIFLRSYYSVLIRNIDSIFFHICHITCPFSPPHCFYYIITVTKYTVNQNCLCSLQTSVVKLQHCKPYTRRPWDSAATSAQGDLQYFRGHRVYPLQGHTGMDIGLEEGQAVDLGKTLDCLLPGPSWSGPAWPAECFQHFSVPIPVYFI